MRLKPRSLSGRLLLAAAALTLAALVIAGGAIGFVLNRFVVHQLEERLDQQTATVADALERGPDGAVRLSRNVDGPPFDRFRSGWYWRVKSGGVELKSASLADERLDVEDDGPFGPPEHEGRRRPRPESRDGKGPEGVALLVRTVSVDVGGTPAEISVAAPWFAAVGPTRDALGPLVVCLALLGIGLGAASFWQVRLGLKPLRDLQASLAEVRAGRKAHVPDDQPSELQPLGRELNALIDTHAAGLASARLHVANLAHGLKTPLATIGVALAEPGRDPDGALSAELARVEGRIRHHLARARAAALSGPARLRTPLKDRLDDLVVALSAIHAARSVSIDMASSADIAVACEGQDVDEMAGNLLDNAFKWAARKIVVEARREGSQVALVIADDGVGLAEEALAEAMMPGRRLDETTPGHGFGLSIARELAELYGGSVALARGAAGGLVATLRLPAAG